jgi:hypothetical protein
LLPTIESEKCDVYIDEKPKDKKKSEVTSLLKNMDMLDKLSSGIRIAVIRRHYGLYKLILSSSRMKTWRGEALCPVPQYVEKLLV